MNSIDDSTYIGVILEEVRDQNKLVLEAVGDMKKNIDKIPKIEADVVELKQDMKVVKDVVKDISAHINNHELRITKLELGRRSI